MASGSKLWRFKYRKNGREKSLSIGPYPDISLLQARRERDGARSILANGGDPSAQKQEAKRVRIAHENGTFAKVAGAYVEKMKKEGRAERTIKKVDWLLSFPLDCFGDVPMREITAPLVLDCLKKIEARGTYETAHRVRSTIGSVFRYGVAHGVADIDPTYALRGALVRPKEKPRAAITDPEKFGELLRAIHGYDGQPTTRIALELLPIVAVRPGELRLANWSEFDFGDAVWSIPAKRMKMKRPHRVPLPSQAVALIEELRPISGNGRYLFPSIRSTHRPISENTLNAALRRLGYTSDQVTSHGFRATFSTIANESGLWSVDAIERALAHGDEDKVRRAYARGEHWDERVRLATWWADLLEELRNSPIGEKIGV